MFGSWICGIIVAKQDAVVLSAIVGILKPLDAVRMTLYKFFEVQDRVVEEFHLPPEKQEALTARLRVEIVPRNEGMGLEQPVKIGNIVTEIQPGSPPGAAA
jgi:hypothetical protein